MEQLQNLTLFSLGDAGVSEKIVEDGVTAEENARKKAQGYALLAGIPALSVDEALFIDGFAPDEQPGVSVRRYLGREATDEELLTIFLEKMKRLAHHQWHANWIYALCLAIPHGKTFLARVSIPTLFTDEPRFPLLPSYPLRSLQIDSCLGKSLCDCTPEEEHSRLAAVHKVIEKLVSEAQALPDMTGA